MFIYFLMSVKGTLKGLKKVYKRKALKALLLGSAFREQEPPDPCDC